MASTSSSTGMQNYRLVINYSFQFSAILLFDILSMQKVDNNLFNRRGMASADVRRDNDSEFKSERGDGHAEAVCGLDFESHGFGLRSTSRQCLAQIRASTPDTATGACLADGVLMCNVALNS